MKKCRFCGGVPYYPTNIKKNKSLTSCSNNKCPIFGVEMTVKQWESSPPEPTVNPDAVCVECGREYQLDDLWCVDCQGKLNRID